MLNRTIHDAVAYARPAHKATRQGRSVESDAPVRARERICGHYRHAHALQIREIARVGHIKRHHAVRRQFRRRQRERARLPRRSRETAARL